MGYKPTKKVYQLSFTDFPGLEIDAVSTSLGRLMHLGTLNIRMDEPDEEKKMELFKTFAGCLVRWNIEHPEIADPNEDGTCPRCGLLEGIAMPCTVQSLMCLDLDFIMPLLFGWMATVSRVSVPKDLSLSDGGKNIQEGVMKMLGQHPNLSTLPTQNLS